MMLMVSCFCFLMMMVMLVWFLLALMPLAFHQSLKILQSLRFHPLCPVLSVPR